MTRRGVPLTKLWQAFDEARFGSERTLNLRASLPTPDEATRRAELWLRQQQIAQPGDVLIITGRGKGSPEGVSAVREAVIRLLHSLKRKGIVAPPGRMHLHRRRSTRSGRRRASSSATSLRTRSTTSACTTASRS